MRARAVDRELEWAAQLGMNSIRLFLHHLLWEVDGHAFLDRVDRVLDIADTHGISTMPVLFDGVWNPRPELGPQADPRPGIHNSRWVQSPGADVLADRSRWPGLRSYVDALFTRFGNDRRVVAWDLFNEPDNPNPAYLRDEVHDKRRLVSALLSDVFDWAVEADPSQPLTVGVYLHPSRAERLTDSARLSLDRSDVVSFHCYSGARRLERTIDRLNRFGRPLLCTESLARPHSPVELVSVFADRNVSAFCWGLVDGRTQTRYPWTSWVRRGGDDGEWFHDLLHADGAPYRREEAEFFAAVCASARDADGPTGPTG